jgi:ribosomal protein S25
LAISRDDNWTGWCEFFLEAVTRQTEENQQKATEILKLYEAKKAQIVDVTHSQYSIHALDFIFSRPIFGASGFAYDAGIPVATAKRILTVLRERGILKTLRKARGRRPAIYAFWELVNTTEGERIFSG